MTIHAAMHTRADMERLRRRTRLTLTAICIVGITLFAGVMIGRGIEKAAYDAVHSQGEWQ